MPSKSSRRLTVILLCSMPPLFAQTGTTPGQSNPSSPGANGSIVSGKDTSPLNAETVINNAATREADAYKTFQAIPDSQFDKKVKTGEEFLRKYSNSQLLPFVYSILSVTYIQGGQPEKGFSDGEKALALRPNDTRTLANLAQAMARLTNADAPQLIEKSEKYATQCIQITPTLSKPLNVSDQDWAADNNKNLAMAHSALGTINLRRGNFSQAVTDLQEAVRLDGGKDVTNYYLLGVASLNSSHYPEAADAFSKCAAPTAPANLQPTCRDGGAQAQKHITAATKSN
jgi:tetratricopeptide (TPR) repeat protein